MASQNIVLTQMTLGTIFSGVMAYLKSAKWAPWFSQHSAKINHAFLLATSAAGAIGVPAVTLSGTGVGRHVAKSL